MPVFRKLLVASAIVGAGLGVALLLGQPAGLKQALVAADQALKSPRSERPATPPAPSTAWSANSVQLVPERHVYPNTAQSAEGFAPPLFEQQPAPVTSGPQFSGTRGEPSQQTTQPELPARARLRSEAPRPIGNEPRSPATIRRAPPAEMQAATAPSVQQLDQLSSSWNAPSTVPVGFATAGNQAVATPAAYDAPHEPANQPLVSPPPWPASKGGEESRMHIVIDGDSLERLANRYLDDPRRSREIYELNRELLANPELLPIGVELKIPERSAQTSWDRNL